MARTPAVRKKTETEAYGQAPDATSDYAKIRRYLDARMQELESKRMSWWTHWGQLARYILPRRYRYLIPPAEWNRGSPINQNIIDNTGTRAVTTLASGMMSGMTSPGRPWFRITSPEADIAQDPEAKLWFEEVQSRMLRVMASSNYYVAKAQQYEDLVVFGTAPMLIYEDYDNVIRCYNPAAGEYYCAEGARFSVDTLYRRITMTVAQTVDEFGEDQCSIGVRQSWQTPGGKDREIIVCHAIEPNPDFVADPSHIGPGGEAKQHRFREYFWEFGGNSDKMLRSRGYAEQPFSCPRWNLIGNDAYGRSPGMDALGDIKQLQLEQKRKAQAIDKIVNPPMLADPSMKNEPASLLPGAVTYASSLNGSVGFRPVYQVNPPLGELTKDIMEVQSRIKDTFFVPLFLMISQLDTVRTATEIDARRQEQLIQLGPVLERNENEGLAPDINRIFQIMARAGLFPQAPDSVAGMPVLKIEYQSMLAEAQQAASLAPLERLWAFTGNLAAALPEALDNLDPDASVREYADKGRVSPKVVRDPRAVEQIRAKRAQAQQAQDAAAMGGLAAQNAKVLSETQVGGGANALEVMLGGAAA
jgi:hypothetical protein